MSGHRPRGRDDQLALFPVATARSIPPQIGSAHVSLRANAAVLARPKGRLAAYDFSLNPYIGCQFGCSYCYAAFFVADAAKRAAWGQWVEVKEHAVRALARRTDLRGARIYMSSATDPYQPLEAQIELTREILAVLADEARQPRLVIQTRSPLVVRDIDLLRRFQHLRVNMTITTDSDAIRKRFEPACPSIERRMAALRELKAAGIRTAATITPMLPLADPAAFGDALAALGCDLYAAHAFHASDVPFAASTGATAHALLHEYRWTDADYRHALGVLRSRLPHLYGAQGFLPE